VANFVDIVKPLQNMIKKDTYFKWTYVEKEVFKKFKDTIVVVSTLHNPEFSKHLSLYTFAFDHSLATMLTQKDVQGDECSISFMNIGLNRVELNYPMIDK
jgi:hypothetical protein